MPVDVAIVPHTHWDREWYLPYQTFRVRLVRLLDELVPLLEQDLSYARFLLDGQTTVVDDYLEIRPEAAPRLARLAASGRLQVGPWMVLMDEFMVSGETIVRDLQRGMARASELGTSTAALVGYLPDMFGHIAQMPQILRLAGLEHAVVWRGVPSTITTTAFWWESPDGSKVRAEYLYGSYSNGRDLPDDAKQLVARANGYRQELGPARLPGAAMLLMNGTDHQLPQPWLGTVVAEANQIQDDYRFAVTSLGEYLPTQPAPVETWRGELRSGARANVLMGVASNRVDIHRLCAEAERALERRAEPLSALLLPPDAYPTALLDLAWTRLIHNSAHDSSCACSADEVVDAVAVRYQEARQIGDALTREALRRVAARLDAPTGATLVVNSTSVDRSGVIEVMAPGEGPLHYAAEDGTPCPTQVLGTVGGEGFTAMVTGRKIRWVLELIRGPELAGVAIGHVDARETAPGEWDFALTAAGPGEPTIDLEETREQLLELGEAGATIRIRQVLAPARRAAVLAPDVPGFGWRTFTAVEGEGPPTAVRAGDGWLANEHLEVHVDAATGTFAVRTSDGLEVAGLDRLVDGGDGGDTYSYSPPASDLIVDAPTEVRISTLEAGPVRARVLVERTYDLPVAAVGDERSCSARTAERVQVTVASTLEVRADERFVRVRAEIDNRARDHRLRAHFPLPATVEGSDAECAFAVLHRGLTAEGGPHEHGLPTFVSRRFVDCSDGTVGLALLHDGLLEYEVVADGREVALTLLRATGYLSRADPSLRPNPAGPLTPLEGPQLQGRQCVEYAVLVHRGDWADARLPAAADEHLVDLERIRGGGLSEASVPPTGRALRVEGAEVSAVTRDASGLVVRLFAAGDEPATVHLERDGAPARGWRVDLLGRPLEAFEGGVPLRPWEIATLRIDEPGA